MKKGGGGGAVSGLVVGRDGRMETNKGHLRIQDVAKAFELLHSNEPGSDEKLLQLLRQAGEDQ